MDRRNFLTKISLALAGGLIVGDAAIEAFARLTHHRKSFPSAGLGFKAEEWRNTETFRALDPSARFIRVLEERQKERTDRWWQASLNGTDWATFRHEYEQASAIGSIAIHDYGSTQRL